MPIIPGSFMAISDIAVVRELLASRRLPQAKRRCVGQRIVIDPQMQQGWRITHPMGL